MVALTPLYPPLFKESTSSLQAPLCISPPSVSFAPSAAVRVSPSVRMFPSYVSIPAGFGVAAGDDRYDCSEFISSPTPSPAIDSNILSGFFEGDQPFFETGAALGWDPEGAAETETFEALPSASLLSPNASSVTEVFTPPPLLQQEAANSADGRYSYISPPFTPQQFSHSPPGSGFINPIFQGLENSAVANLRKLRPGQLMLPGFHHPSWQQYVPQLNDDLTDMVFPLEYNSLEQLEEAGKQCKPEDLLDTEKHYLLDLFPEPTGISDDAIPTNFYSNKTPHVPCPPILIFPNWRQASIFADMPERPGTPVPMEDQDDTPGMIHRIKTIMHKKGAVCQAMDSVSIAYEYIAWIRGRVFCPWCDQAQVHMTFYHNWRPFRQHFGSSHAHVCGVRNAYYVHLLHALMALDWARNYIVEHDDVGPPGDQDNRPLSSPMQLVTAGNGHPEFCGAGARYNTNVEKIAEARAPAKPRCRRGTKRKQLDE